MPRSKRSREVALTQTSKRSTREHKTAYIAQVREALDQHEALYLFSFENMRTHQFKKVRQHFRNEPVRLFLGKNKLLQIALGRTPEEEYADNLRHVSKRIAGGSIGLLLTSCPQKVESYLAQLVEPDFARAGAEASRDVTVEASRLEFFPVSMVEQFRKLGLPVDVKEGKVVLRDGRTEFGICKAGEVLSAEKCKLLEHFDIKLVNFSVKLECRWSNGEFEELS